MNKDRWQFWIDVGGTFTDCVGASPDSNEYQAKVLSSGLLKGAGCFCQPNCFSATELQGADNFYNGAKIEFFSPSRESIGWATIVSSRATAAELVIDREFELGPDMNLNYQLDCGLTAPILGMHLLTGTPIDQPLADCDVFLGTTKGTNALLTRSGAKTALITSAGLTDFLTIGDQTRTKLFDLAVRNPPPLFTAAISIHERTLADGTVELPVDEDQVRSQLQQLKQQGIESIAVCLIHGFRYPANETIVKELARKIGFRDVRLSSEVAPLIKLISRGETTVLDAYLNPVIADYLDSIRESIGSASKLQLITSAGVLADQEQFSGKDSVLSGPAGGIVGAAGIARQLGFEKCIGFDMGGTSTDVARYDGDFELQYESTKAGIRIVSPMMAIETVAAGGGSICDFDGTRLKVGPESAGADPGPACYGAGGPLTITDINLYLGRFDESRFPFPVHREAVSQRLATLVEKVTRSGSKTSELELAQGFLKIANHNMASAISTISVGRGFDPRDYLLVSFGGAGSQHCCGVAVELGISKILVHPKSSILSAFGIRLADQSYSAAHSILNELTESSLKDARHFADKLTETLTAKFDNANDLMPNWSIDLRFAGTQSSSNLRIDSEWNLEELKARFHRQHQQLYGYTQDRPIELVCVRASVTKAGRQLAQHSLPESVRRAQPKSHTKFFSKGTKQTAAVFDWTTLKPGDQVEGPAIIADAFTSIIVDIGWVATVCAEQQIMLEQTKFQSVSSSSRDDRIADPTQLEIFYSSFRSIAQKMGIALCNTAISVNVKERLDFSCAVFSSSGELVVNAPHIPVHLGAMSDAVRATIQLNSNIKPGDVFITNDPYAGGSHLPDVTVLTPFFYEGDGPVFWLANRAHHAEIGGIAPGSMPARATRLEEEGVLIENFQIVKHGRSQFELLRQILSTAKFPSRNPDENIADITAQIAANQMGCDQLNHLIERNSLNTVSAYAEHIRSAAESKIKSALGNMPDFDRKFEDQMDDGTRLCVRMIKTNSQMAINFDGSDDVHKGNLNANRSIVSSTVMYVLRCLIDENIPLNSGVLRAVSIELPEDCFLNPSAGKDRASCPAIVGGNVETSQRLVDVMLGCIGVAAASQGTMNNWLIGDSGFGYYETIGGGSGATADTDGADAIHCHMSNTRLTDPEILETRYPMILREFAIRQDSGGAGRCCGGNGMIREIEFTRELTLSILASRRTTQPFGLEGGGPGLAGEAKLIRADHTVEILASQCECQVRIGDRLRIATPGGGGFGDAQ